MRRRELRARLGHARDAETRERGRRRAAQCRFGALREPRRVERVGATGIGSPAIVVIGRVAALADDPAVRAALGGRA